MIESEILFIQMHKTVHREEEIGRVPKNTCPVCTEHALSESTALHTLSSLSSLPKAYLYEQDVRNWSHSMKQLAINFLVHPSP